uniref:pogo transposable element with ZNF domain isoform X1 n=1 Tax=Doryrhamphus excisus TaxID=161450 RepID=UPI0025AE155B|nr:pogo transposable element with ZNF domain isoform X1 [Doryrhamphus excisus]XP_057903526.1 pogo transposable element with ZNF domain isoform X1 [Doryrhamphus excisus]XP_057903527.1 pogo transposable element with ZNF domain isoform X1 [Doryrhamphus excisus]
MMESMDADSDSLMEYDEAEQEKEFPEEDEDVDMKEDAPAVRVIPIPLLSVNSPQTLNNTVKPSGSLLSFMVNGRHVPPAGGRTELKLHFHPGGTSSGFVTVQVTPAAGVTSSPPPTEPTPIITGVVSGEAAQKVFNEHKLNVISQKHEPSDTPPHFPRRSALAKTGISKGPIRPFKCLVCSSQFKLIPALRGFICLCSPTIAESLQKMKKQQQQKKKRHKRHKEKNTCKVSRTHTAAVSSVRLSSMNISMNKLVLRYRSHDVFVPQTDVTLKTPLLSDDALPEQLASPTPPGTPQLIQEEPAHPGKLVIMLDEFYYGCDAGQSRDADHLHVVRHLGTYRCIYCLQTLLNNIKLMSHMKMHASKMAEQDQGVDSVSSCPDCFRRFSSSFALQCHMETVHAQYESSAKCKICELNFGSEPSLLIHMKTTHEAGEMPYVCQVCDFRSSFYSDVWNHFEEVHADTKNLMCPYCLRVLQSSSCYQQHIARHQEKFAFGCDKCRLHFLYIKERLQHKQLHHSTHITPTQLTELKPGTKVTIRTYSVVAENEKGRTRTLVPCKVVDVEDALPPRETLKRKPRESLGHLLSDLNSEEDDVVRPTCRCVECLKYIEKFTAHFPSVVHCSLCTFTTCCSCAYANHMIDEHTLSKKKPRYPSIFQLHKRLQEELSCMSCSYCTYIGDLMAAHLINQPGHLCVTSGHSKRISKADNKSPTWSSHSVASPKDVGGAFVPIHLLPSHQPSHQLSIKALTSPFTLSSPAAMTIKVLRPLSQPEEVNEKRNAAMPLSVKLLPSQERLQAYEEWEWRVARWVLTRREQQLHISKDVLLQTGESVVRGDDRAAESYRRVVDFLFHQPQPSNKHGHLPRKVLLEVMENSRTFILSLCSQIQSAALLPRSVGFMDELSIFVNVDQFSRQNPAAFKLLGLPGETPLFDVVLSALSDGTSLTPMLFFRGEPIDIPEGFPDNVLLEARRGGFTDAERLHLWTEKVWRLRPQSNKSKSLLMVDVYRGHVTDGFKSGLSATSTDAIFIPAGCCSRLQPLDVCVKPVLHNFLQGRWNHLVCNGGLDGLGLGQLALTMACWLSEVSSTLSSDACILKRSFASVCHLQKEQKDTDVMIQILTGKLMQPVPSPPPPKSLHFLLVLHEPNQSLDQKHNSQGGNPQGGNPQGGNPQGGNPQGGNPQGGNPQGGISQGGISQGGISQGGISQGDISQGDISQGDISQGDNSQGDNSQGDNSQGDNSQGDNSENT